jgi:hypothetical protein
MLKNTLISQNKKHISRSFQGKKGFEKDFENNMLLRLIS